jgi:hypothetical protein
MLDRKTLVKLLVLSKVVKIAVIALLFFGFLGCTSPTQPYGSDGSVVDSLEEREIPTPQPEPDGAANQTITHPPEANETAKEPEGNLVEDYNALFDAVNGDVEEFALLAQEGAGAIDGFNSDSSYANYGLCLSFGEKYAGFAESALRHISDFEEYVGLKEAELTATGLDVPIIREEVADLRAGYGQFANAVKSNLGRMESIISERQQIEQTERLQYESIMERLARLVSG